MHSLRHRINSFFGHDWRNCDFCTCGKMVGTRGEENREISCAHRPKLSNVSNSLTRKSLMESFHCFF